MNEWLLSSVIIRLIINIRTTTSSSSSASAAASRRGLHHVTNDNADEQGDHRDHVTERWRHHRPVAHVRITNACNGGQKVVFVVVVLATNRSGMCAVTYHDLFAWTHMHTKTVEIWLFLIRSHLLEGSVAIHLPRRLPATSYEHVDDFVTDGQRWAKYISL